MDIPDDVEKASAIVFHRVNDCLHTYSDDAIGQEWFDWDKPCAIAAIARAIMAERERCARIVEDKRWGGDSIGITESLCKDIAAAIRKPTDNNP